MGLFKEIASVIKLDSRYEVDGVRVRGRKGGGGRERRPEEESFLLKELASCVYIAIAYNSPRSKGREFIEIP